jgi:4'-phosphopantetheinyl transferase EntD
MSPAEENTELARVLKAIVPQPCAVGAACFAEGDEPASLAEEASHIAPMGPARRREYTGGRAAARAALAEIGYPSASLLPDADGLPQWPEGTRGSISHCKGHALCVVAPAARLSLLGLDVEKTNRLGSSAMRRVVHPLEEEWVQADQMRGSVLFSLKEAFYKAQFARWATPASFKSLALQVDWPAGRASVAGLDERFVRELEKMELRFARSGNFVVSLAFLAVDGDTPYSL